MQKACYEQGESRLGYAGLCKLLTAWRNSAEMSWLAEAPVHPLQQALKNFERAYSNFFAKRADFPRFKKKGQSDSFRYPDPKQIKLDQANSRLFLPKLGWLRYRNSRDVLGTVKNDTWWRFELHGHGQRHRAERPLQKKKHADYSLRRARDKHVQRHRAGKSDPSNSRLGGVLDFKAMVSATGPGKATPPIPV